MHKDKENQIRWKQIDKLGTALLAPAGAEDTYDSQGVDCPFVFRHNDRYYMLHVGFDGIGYRTALAESTDLLDWSGRRLLFAKEKNPRIAGVWVLRENDLTGNPVLKKAFGKYWMVVHSYPREGYEQGPASISLAWTEDEALEDWHLLPEAILRPEEGNPWERGGLYKGCLVENKGKFFLFYNAKDRDSWPWTEQIGLAVSDDLFHWERAVTEPILSVSPGSWDSLFTSDPFVVRHEGRWLMFYYGYDGIHAQDGLAVSDDLWHWTKCAEPVLRVGNPGEIDDRHAHKPCVIAHKGALYHFYCAVREAQPGQAGTRSETSGDGSTGGEGPVRTEYRCITAATRIVNIV